MYASIFKSGNTHRITLPRHIMHALKAKTGDVLRVAVVREGVVEVINATRRDQLERQEKRRK